MDIVVIAIRKMFSYMQSEIAPYFLKLGLYRPCQAVLGESWFVSSSTTRAYLLFVQTLLKGKMAELTLKYGNASMVVYLGISLTSLSICYCAVSRYPPSISLEHYNFGHFIRMHAWFYALLKCNQLIVLHPIAPTWRKLVQTNKPNHQIESKVLDNGNG